MRKLRQGLAMVLSVLLVLVSVGCGSNAENKVEWGRADAKEIDVNSKIAGRVVELLVKEGDEVRAGQVIARIDKRDLVFRLELLERLPRDRAARHEFGVALVVRLREREIRAGLCLRMLRRRKR